MTDDIVSGGAKQRVGSRAQVMHGTAQKTAGGLTRKDLKMNKWGRIVSRAKSAKAKKENRLSKMGFKTQKGKFGIMKKKSKKTRRGGAEKEEEEEEEEETSV